MDSSKKLDCSRPHPKHHNTSPFALANPREPAFLLFTAEAGHHRMLSAPPLLSPNQSQVSQIRSLIRNCHVTNTLHTHTHSMGPFPFSLWDSSRVFKVMTLSQPLILTCVTVNVEINFPVPEAKEANDKIIYGRDEQTK